MKDFIVNDEQSLGKMLEKVRSAQEKFAAYTQEQVDKIFFAAAVAANKARILWRSSPSRKRVWASRRIR